MPTVGHGTKWWCRGEVKQKHFYMLLRFYLFVETATDASVLAQFRRTGTGDNRLD